MEMDDLLYAATVEELEHRYDKAAKTLLSNKSVLAYILKETVIEYKDCTLAEIESYIDEPKISEVGVDPEQTNPTLKG